MSDKFTIYAYDLNTNTLVGELPGTDLRFDSRLNGAGAISFNLSLATPKSATLAAPLLAYGGRPVALYVDRDGIIVWGGIGWTGNYQKSSGMLEVGGKEFGSYFAKRVTVADYSETTYPAGLDPAELIYKIFTDAQNPALAGAGASIGLNVVGTTSDLPVTIPGYPLAQYTFVSRIAEDMAAISAPGAGGIDTSITSAWDPTSGLPVNTLQVWSPRVGRAAGESGVFFDLANVVDYSWPTDAESSATTIIATGSGNGDAMPVATANAPGVPVGGLGQSPRLDMVASTTAQSQGQVSLMANGLAAQYGEPLTTPTITVRTGERGQPLGSWIVGDDARVYVESDPRHPNGLDEYWRIVQQQVEVPNEGVATVTLTLNLPPIY